jgi:hypothetical protein
VIVVEDDLARRLIEIGESVSIFYEPRNEGEEWTVGLEREPMMHGHFRSLIEGLDWLVKCKPEFP